MKKKILFIAFQNSIHTARWIKQIADHKDFDIHLFPINTAEIHEELKSITVHKPIINFSLKKINPIFSRKQTNFNKIKYLYPILLPNILIRIFNKIKTKHAKQDTTYFFPLHGSKNLAKLIKKIKPDLIHSLEFQTCSYLVLETKNLLKDSFPKWMATNWGSDIYYFQNIPYHKNKIKELLKEIDFYASECERDVNLAKNLGFKQQVIPVMPNTGGFNLKEIKILRNKIVPSKRKYIMVKGYQSFAGRALTALEAITHAYDTIKDYIIVLFSASPVVVSQLEIIKKKFNNLNFLILPHNTSHNEILKYFAQARIYLGVSISDAISTSMLEALSLGAFPIQTNTSCCEEWIEHGKTGFSIPHNNIDIIADYLIKALTNDALVDKAMQLNWDTACEKLDALKLKHKTINIYQKILE